MYLPYKNSRNSLLPRDLGELIPPNAPVRILNSLIEKLDLSEFDTLYSEEGRPSYAPEMMLKLLIFAYMSSVYSCRDIERFAQRDLHAYWLVGGQVPEFSTINRFRKKSGLFIKNVFIQIVTELYKMGLLDFKDVYVDGTTIQARGKASQIVWRKSVENRRQRNSAKIEALLAPILHAIEESDYLQEYKSSPEVPLTSVDVCAIASRVEAALAEKATTLSKTQEQESRKALKEIKTRGAKQASYEADLQQMGERNSFVRTDPDATAMILKEDRKYSSPSSTEVSTAPNKYSASEGNNQAAKTAYDQKQPKARGGRSLAKPSMNVQIATNNQIVTDFSVHQTSSDTQTLSSTLDAITKNYDRSPERIIADAGYGSEENYKAMKERNCEAFVKYPGFHHEQTKAYRDNIFHPKHLPYDADGDFYTCPNGKKLLYKESKIKERTGSENRIYQCENCYDCQLRELCYKGKENRLISVNPTVLAYQAEVRERLLSEEGQRLYAQRSIEPESVFGQLKGNKGLRRSAFFGKTMFETDLAFRIIAHDIWKIPEIKPKKRVRQSKKKNKARKCGI